MINSLVVPLITIIVIVRFQVGHFAMLALTVYAVNTVVYVQEKRKKPDPKPVNGQMAPILEESGGAAGGASSGSGAAGAGGEEDPHGDATLARTGRSLSLAAI